MAKVCSKTHCTTSFLGVQLEGSISRTGPNVQEFRNSSGDACHVGHPDHSTLGSRPSAAPNQTGAPASLLRSVIKLFKLGRLDYRG